MNQIKSVSKILDAFTCDDFTKHVRILDTLELHYRVPAQGSVHKISYVVNAVTPEFVSASSGLVNKTFYLSDLESPEYTIHLVKQSDGNQDHEEKPFVQGRKYDSGKPMYNLLPAHALEEVVKVLTYGAMKYNEPIDQENWRLVENPQQRYFAACQRHLWAIRRGELNDPESSISHYAHAITSLMFLLQLELEKSKV